MTFCLPLSRCGCLRALSLSVLSRWKAVPPAASKPNQNCDCCSAGLLPRAAKEEVEERGSLRLKMLAKASPSTVTARQQARQHKCMLCSIWLAGSLLTCCDAMSLLVLLMSLPLPHYRCLTTALLCVIALSAFAVWLYCERGSSLLGLAGAPASMDVASHPSEQVAREARQGQARLPA